MGITAPNGAAIALRTSGLELMDRRLIWLAGITLALALTAPAAEHPVPLEKDADCATCHEDKTKGKAVHTAIPMGCATCHEVKTENEVTTVNLISPKQELCLTCHAGMTEEPVKHGPAAKGNCSTCHDPHVSDFPKQLRAETNALCFTCHGSNPATQQVDRDARTVTLFGKEKLTFDEFRLAKKIGLDPGKQSGHPMPGHPLSGADPATKKPITCLTCHQPHSSTMPKLLPSTVKSDLELCSQCHK